VCISPNHVLIPRHKQEELAQGFREAYKQFFPSGKPLDGSSTYGRIVNPTHFRRLKGLLDRTKGDIVTGGGVEGERGMEPTVVKDVTYDDSLLEEELFGPVLALVPVDDIDEAIRWINNHPHPLALYVFTEDASVKQKFLTKTNSGSLIFNDTFGQLAVFEAPFGGHGESGYGYQHSHHTFNTFTHLRTSIDVPQSAEPHLGLRYAPYSKDATEIMSHDVYLKIPSISSFTNGHAHDANGHIAQ